MSLGRIRWMICIVIAQICLVGAAAAQVLEAVDDRYGIPFGLTLEVEPFGVLDNDLLDGENAGENGVTASLVTDVQHGTLDFNSDGSFTYQVGTGFDGADQFVYRAEFGSATAEATVVLSACDGGPDFFTCWNETAFLTEIQALSYVTFLEGFEDDVVWGHVRTPDSAPSVVSQGVEWRSNHPDPPPMNPISTTPGPPHSGLWAVYDPNHGYATGTPTECDIDNPPEHCLYHDGFSGTREPGFSTLHAVGGYLDGTYGSNVGILLDGVGPFGGGHLTGGHQFFGVLDARPAGFSQFEFREQDGKVGQAFYVFGDDFTFAADIEVGVPEAMPIASITTIAPNPMTHGGAVRFALQSPARLRLEIFDIAGRLVRRLADEHRAAGSHEVEWDGRDRFGLEMPNGIYFARLITDQSGVGNVTSQRIVVIE